MSRYAKYMALPPGAMLDRMLVDQEFAVAACFLYSEATRLTSGREFGPSGPFSEDQIWLDAAQAIRHVVAERRGILYRRLETNRHWTLIEMLSPVGRDIDWSRSKHGRDYWDWYKGFGEDMAYLAALGGETLPCVEPPSAVVRPGDCGLIADYIESERPIVRKRFGRATETRPMWNLDGVITGYVTAKRVFEEELETIALLARLYRLAADKGECVLVSQF